jgi:thiol-disulfide isomerase/thioredoxin
MDLSNVDVATCHFCGTKNRIPPDRDPEAAKCGKCGKTLSKGSNPPNEQKAYTLRCSACHTKNKIPAAKLDAGPKCGKCGAQIKTEELFIPQPVIVTDTNFDQMVMNSPLPVLVFAWATWCPSCGAYASVVDEFARDSKGMVRVAKMNVDNSPTQASKYNILSVPFMFIFDNGQMKENFPGGLPKHDLMLKMGHYL